MDGKVIVIRYGRSSFRIVEVLSDEEALRDDSEADDGY
jgi:hypothetical protein